ncbi:phosphoglucomutase/phosphomannomutase family protein [Butyrivibrio sp. CB08]|uniref:phosphoglucomutase/phosphomannomutase family protein n=1 Tax=Butyrivibrio sp. CB08 TaxID=2364879 RepID=UPI000EA9DDBE|nr:phosphoglucomutase/phosphomannomutase family protein [Butyrivibrio sp. CB08]RKM60600.1 phosphoglucomutase/phosphomannomutase family protein [Butyrivibrio sp. CB08]
MIRFGTGGWRAVIGDEFTKENVQILSQAMASKMKAEHLEEYGIVLGYDRRFLSKEAMQWAAVVFAANGIKASLINKSSPTPLVMFYVMKHDLPYGMMVTASHNPAIYNGIKLFTREGRDADETVTADVERYIEDVALPVKSMDYEDAKAQGLIIEFYPINEYIDNILDRVNVEAIKAAGLRVALDPMYGVSETAIKTILLTARCEMETIHSRHDTLFGGKLPAPNEGAMSPLMTCVKDYHCDIGIATDGDADRIGVVDDKGRYLSPNDILVLLYYYLVKYRKEHGPVVRNLCTTHMLDRIAERFGEECYEVPVGFKHISAGITEHDALIGGESSGGLTVRGHINGKDGVYAAALLVEMLAVTGRRISEIYDDIRQEFGTFYMVEKNFTFKAAKKPEYKKILMEDKLLPEFPIEIQRTSYMDGCKVYFKNGGWVCARFSGTEPLLRIFCEMDDHDLAEDICRIFRDFLGLEVEQ